MTTAVIDLSSYKLLVTTCTPEFLESGKHFPENLHPSNIFGPQKHDKFIYVPQFINRVLAYWNSMSINKWISFWTVHPFFLVVREQIVAIRTFIQHIVFFLEKLLKFFHVQL